MDVELVAIPLERGAVEVRDATHLLADDAGGVVERAARARPWPASKSRRSSATIDCVSDRLPLVSRTSTRSFSRTKVCIFRQTFTWS